MFTGIVEGLGQIEMILELKECKTFRIKAPDTFTDLKLGDSVSVNGVCLTVVHLNQTRFEVTAVPETLRLTNLGLLELEAKVNLERSMLASARIGGHYVQGHVDGQGEILEIKAEGQALLVKIGVRENLARYLVKKGYVGIDGMSITVIDVGPTWFTVTFIPHSQEVTLIKNYKVGTLLNIEVDILAKYAEKLLGVPSHD